MTSPRDRVHRLELSSRLAELTRMRQFLRDACESFESVDPECVQALEQAAYEAATNIVKHAYGGRADGRIAIEVRLHEGAVEITMTDRGEAFDPDVVASPTFDGTSDGGFGVHIMHRLLDSLEYSRDDTGRNVTRLSKRIGR